MPVLPPPDPETLRYLWMNHDLDWICTILGCGRRRVYYWAKKYDLGPKPPGTLAPRKPQGPPDPTPEEFRQRVAEVQARWTPAERERRAGKSKMRSVAKAFGYTGRGAPFTAKTL